MSPERAAVQLLANSATGTATGFSLAAPSIVPMVLNSSRFDRSSRVCRPSCRSSLKPSDSLGRFGRVAERAEAQTVINARIINGIGKV
jgi:hypothetical protein